MPKTQQRTQNPTNIQITVRTKEPDASDDIAPKRLLPWILRVILMPVIVSALTFSTGFLVRGVIDRFSSASQPRLYDNLVKLADQSPNGQDTYWLYRVFNNGSATAENVQFEVSATNIKSAHFQSIFDCKKVVIRPTDSPSSVYSNEAYCKLGGIHPSQEARMILVCSKGKRIDRTATCQNGRRAEPVSPDTYERIHGFASLP